MVDFEELGWAALDWALAVLFGVVALVAAVFSPAAPAMFVGLVGAALVIVCAPPLRRRIEKEFRIKVNGFAQFVICGALSALMWNVYSDGQALKQRLAAAAAEQEAADRLAAQREAERAATLAEFQKNKGSILMSLADLVKAEQLEAAYDQASKYAAVSPDRDLARAKDIVESAKLKARLRDQAGLTLEERLAMYSRLAELDPASGEFAVVAKKLRAELDYEVEMKRQAEVRAAARERDRQRVASQFSTWDGSHPVVERAVKASMKNPSSYEHVSTRFSIQGSEVIVTTTFRGTNSFGAVVPTTATATLDTSGRLLSIR